MRSALYVPGNRQSMLQKAQNFAADILILDLEDSVPQQEKETARNLVRSMLPGMAVKGQGLIVRTNSFASGMTEADLKVIVCPELDGIMLPKTEAVNDVKDLDKLLTQLEKERGIRAGKLSIHALLETSLAIVNVNQIAFASPRLVSLAFGAEDYTRDMGIARTSDDTAIFYPRAAIAIAARAANIASLDTPYTAYKDEEGMRRDCEFARKIGFTGKQLIHPAQIELTHEIFSPAAEDIRKANKIVEAFDAAVAQGLGSISVEGKMVDKAIADRARQLITYHIP